MPNTLKLNLGSDNLELTGEFTVAEADSVIREFVRGRGPDATQEQVDALTAQARAANDAEEAAVASNTPTT